MVQTIPNRPTTHGTYTPAILVEFERRVSTGPGTYTSTYFRYTSFPRAITYNGAANFYSPAVGAAFAHADFRIGPLVTTLDGQQAMEVEFDDHNDIFKGLGLVYDFLDWKARVWEVGLNSSDQTTYLKLKIDGRSEGMDWNVEGDTNICVIPIGPDIMGAEIQGPLEEYTPTCRFRFKSARCGYVGAETVCNRTLDRCTTLGNKTRFGGFTRAPAPNQPISSGGRILVFPSREQYFPQQR